jgi:hypothetical protein
MDLILSVLRTWGHILVGLAAMFSFAFIGLSIIKMIVNYKERR